MNGPRRSGPPPNDPHGDRAAWRPSLGFIAIAVGIVVGGIVHGVMSSASSSPSTAPAAGDATTRAASPASASSSSPATSLLAAASASATMPARAASAMADATPQISRTRDPNGDQTPDLADYVNKGEKPTMAEVIDRLHKAGVNTGLGAFSPPGTRPPLVGLAVPEGFALPEGYVRHYQATDDGQRIEPILMFAPGFQLFDANHQPIAMPKDRVVPPELAPPGLPIRRIAIPAPVEPR